MEREGGKEKVMGKKKSGRKKKWEKKHLRRDSNPQPPA